MTRPTKQQVLALLRTGTSEERIAFLKTLPANEFKDTAATLIGSNNPGMVIVALGPVIQQYCYGSNPEVGAVLAVAAHERAVEIWQTVPNHGLIPTTLSGLACAHVKALSLLGRSEEVIEATEEYIPLYEKLGERENLPSLKVLRIEALVNLKRLDDADAELQDEALCQHPIVGIEAKRLKGWVDRYREDPTGLKSEQESAPNPPSLQEFLELMKRAFGPSFEGEAGKELKNQVDQMEEDDLGLDLDEPLATEQEVAPADPPPVPPLPSETRWLNAAIRDHDSNEPLRVGESYLLEFGVDLKAWGDANKQLPPASQMFKPEEEFIELTILLQSSDFDIAQDVQTLKLPRTGPSKGRARFDIVPRQEGRGKLTAIIHKERNFVMQMEITYSIGAMIVETPRTVVQGRTLVAAASLRPRKICMHIKPASADEYECLVIVKSAKRIRLPVTGKELDDAIKTARDGLMSVVSQRDESSRLVFQTGLDVDTASSKKALQMLAKSGARLFQRIFFGPSAGSDLQQVGEFLRMQTTNPNEQLTLQIVAERFPIPWGLLYTGDVSKNAPLSWDNFLGMRYVIEQIPITNNLVDNDIIQSDKPSLAVSINVNCSIDEKMKTDVVARQLRFWQDGAAALGTHLQLAQRQNRADFLDALNGNANDQLMYLYCHAATAGLGDPGGISASFIILTGDERLTLDDLNLEAPMTRPLDGNPLVFINACESAELTSAFYDGFVPYFMAKRARGVIGTECKMPAVFAAEWALRFFPRFLGGEALGELFLDLRQEFCTRHNNPLGLLYVVYCNADTQIQPGLTI